MVFLYVLLIIVILLITSKIRIEIDNFKFFSNIKQSHLNDKYNIKIKLQVLNKIPILWTNINKSKIQKLKEKEKFKNINLNFKDIKKDISLKNLKQNTSQINIEIKKFYLNTEIGTDSTMFTSMLISLLSSGIAIILASKKVKQENQNFQIKPIYNSRQFSKSSLFRYIWNKNDTYYKYNNYHE